jgi:hypothetical protein
MSQVDYMLHTMADDIVDAIKTAQEKKASMESRLQAIEAGIEELRDSRRPVSQAHKYVDFPTAIKALICEGKSIYLSCPGPAFRITAPLESGTLCSFSASNMMSKNWVIVEKET